LIWIITVALLALTTESGFAQNRDAPAAAAAAPVKPAPAAAQNRAPGGAPAKEERNKIEDDLNPVQLQIVDHLRPLLALELAFARRTCRLSKDKLRILSDAGEECLRALARESNSGGDGGNIRGRIIVGNMAVAMPFNSQKALQDRLAAVISQNLPAETAASYKVECDKRSEFQKQMAVNNTVCIIDKKLMLTEAQRQQICDSLAKTWKDSDLPDQRTFTAGIEYIPPIPDNCVLPYLRPAQKAVWQTRERQSHIAFGFVSPTVVFEDNPPGD
jgi:hypothetical protein